MHKPVDCRSLLLPDVVQLSSMYAVSVPILDLSPLISMLSAQA